jgi:hypothetical protein
MDRFSPCNVNKPHASTLGFTPKRRLATGHIAVDTLPIQDKNHVSKGLPSFGCGKLLFFANMDGKTEYL